LFPEKIAIPDEARQRSGIQGVFKILSSISEPMESRLIVGVWIQDQVRDDK